MEYVIPLGVITILILANGVFVAAEFAIVGAPRSTIDHLASRGDRLAVGVKWVLDDPRRQDRYIATAQIGITIASLGLGMYGEHYVAEWVASGLDTWGSEVTRWIAGHVVGSVVSITLLTYFHIVVGEMVPKALALQHAAATARYITPLVQALQKIALPLVVGLNAIGNAVLRLLGVQRQTGTERYHTSDELQFIILESQKGGLLRSESGAILRELFEFGDLTAGEVMMPRVRITGVPVGTEPDQLRAIVRANPHTRYPVHTGDLDHVIGSLHIKDVLRHLVSHQPVTARDARPLPYIPETVPLDQVLAAMRRLRAQMAVVMDEYGGTAGLVTIEDLFEEVVGEIEEGRGRAPIVRDGEGRLHVRGTVRLTEVSEALASTVEHPAVSSVSGLVLTLLGRPAVAGDVVTWNHVRIDVTAVAGRGIADAMITLLVSPPESGS